MGQPSPGPGAAMTFGSLFAGIGGMDLGLERAGMVCKWQVEIDPFARKVLDKHWPNVPKYGDIREVRGDELEPVDLIAGGFPCQDISDAGLRAGITGERSGLWTEYLRLVRELRPRYILVENVAALAWRGLDVVLGDLSEGGYDADWQTISAASVGAPHIRERVFVVAYSERQRWAKAPILTRASLERGEKPLPPWGPMGGILRTDHRGRVWCFPDPPPERVFDGFPARMDGLKRDEQWGDWPDRLRVLGNAVVPQVAELIGRAILAAETDLATAPHMPTRAT